MGVTELGQSMGTDPNVALSVLEGLGRWEAGRSAGGMDPRRKGWGRLQEHAEESSSSSRGSSSSGGGRSTTTTSGRRTPPPKAPKKKPRHLESSEEEPPPPKPSRASPRPRPSPRARARAKPAPPPPRKSQASPLQDRCQDPYGNVPAVGDTRYVPWAEGGNEG